MSNAPLSLSPATRVHVVGIGGPGMSALARVLLGMGVQVSGSDLRDSAVLGDLRRAGAVIHLGHDAGHVASADIVTYSTAIPESNPELVAARGLGITTVHRSGALAAVCASARAVAVAGTHGKTTTSTLLVHLLLGAGVDTSWLIGADPLGDMSAAHWDAASSSRLFVVEADESDGTHDALPLWGSVLTNIDKDHLDHFGTLDAIVASFAAYLGRLAGPVVICGDDERATASLIDAGLEQDPRTVRYGFDQSNDVRAEHVEATEQGSKFTLSGFGERVAVELPLHGSHNVLNFAGAAAMARSLGVPLETSARTVRDFAGVERRLEEKGAVGGALVYDDYAHVPAEIEATLAAVRARHRGSRVIAVFQPNRYHRIASMHGDYAGCFGAADAVVITDIYASGTSPIDGVTGRLVADAVGSAHRGDVTWAATRADVVAALLPELGPGVVCVGMGCGDIGTLYADLLATVGDGPDGAGP